ncbi:MAG: hypothetical protein DRJ49_02650 [Thermoprotei archaeon]|nr:MAG: hypothetical protein DRJ49_02650 [Thermoprotei archaeon]
MVKVLDLKRHVCYMIVAAIIALLITVLLHYPTLLHLEELGRIVVPRPKSIAVARLSGLVVYSEERGLLPISYITPNYVEDLLEEALKENPGALILVINSPGGEPSACYEIYHMLKRYKEEHNITLVVYIPSIACSGGYYISLAADEIVVNPDAMVGSVGAIGMIFSYVDLFKKLGVEVKIVRSGKFKGLTSPFKRIEKEDIEFTRRIVYGTYRHFVDILMESRGDKLREENLTDILNAMIYLGDEALKVGLVDSIGTLEEAKERARELAGLPENTPVVEVRPRIRRITIPLLPWSILVALEYLIPKAPSNSIKIMYMIGT